jgi:DNA-binding MarR family transcriptional regulator
MADEPADDFMTEFWAAKRALALAAGAAFAQHGVHEGQQFILRRLWASDGQTPGELARALELSTPTVTRAATRMQAVGLVRRAPHPTDRRLVVLHLTERGAALEHVIDQEMARLTDRALAGVPDPASVTRALRTIRTNLAR